MKTVISLNSSVKGIKGNYSKCPCFNWVKLKISQSYTITTYNKNYLKSNTHDSSLTSYILNFDFYHYFAFKVANVFNFSLNCFIIAKKFNQIRTFICNWNPIET